MRWRASLTQSYRGAEWMSVGAAQLERAPAAGCDAGPPDETAYALATGMNPPLDTRRF